MEKREKNNNPKKIFYIKYWQSREKERNGNGRKGQGPNKQILESNSNGTGHIDGIRVIVGTERRVQQD